LDVKLKEEGDLIRRAVEEEQSDWAKKRAVCGCLSWHEEMMNGIDGAQNMHPHSIDAENHFQYPGVPKCRDYGF
jgi:hypothetical protein